MSSHTRNRFEHGYPPAELWGVSKGAKPRKRGPTACARRAARTAARRMGVAFKAYLRMEAEKAARSSGGAR